MDGELSINEATGEMQLLDSSEAARAEAEVKAAIISAKRFPRDQMAAEKRILVACSRLSLAEDALYEYSRGGAEVSGPSIRLAEVLAQCWGNIDFGFTEHQTDGKSTILAHCIDLETNTRRRLGFVVPHVRYSRDGGRKSLEGGDPRDIYEVVANYAQRRVRACILAIIPGDIVQKAVNACRDTMAKGDGSPITDRVPRMLKQFEEEFAVTQEDIERKLGHKASAITDHELVTLRTIYKSLRDGFATKEKFFPPADAAGVPQGKQEEKKKPGSAAKAEAKAAEATEAKADEKGTDTAAREPNDERLPGADESEFASEAHLTMLKQTCDGGGIDYNVLVSEVTGIKETDEGAPPLTLGEYQKCLAEAIKRRTTATKKGSK